MQPLTAAAELVAATALIAKDGGKSDDARALAPASIDANTLKYKQGNLR